MSSDKEMKACGRPAGRRKTAKIEIAIEPEVKEAFMAICYEEGKNASTQLYQYIREYIKTYKEEQ